MAPRGKHALLMKALNPYLKNLFGKPCNTFWSRRANLCLFLFFQENFLSNYVPMGEKANSELKELKEEFTNENVLESWFKVSLSKAGLATWLFFLEVLYTPRIRMNRAFMRFMDTPCP